jgi:ubiquinone biosynthesis protein Coq4
MTQNQVWNNLMQSNQAVLENAFTAMTLLQEQTERMLNLSLDQATLLPKEGKKVFTEWVKVWAKGNEILKKSVDDSFHRMEGFLS